MREQKYHLYLSEDECRFLVQNLIWFQNKLRHEGRYTDTVDDADVHNGFDKNTRKYSQDTYCL